MQYYYMYGILLEVVYKGEGLFTRGHSCFSEENDFKPPVHGDASWGLEVRLRNKVCSNLSVRGVEVQ